MSKQKIILACLLLFTIAPAVPARQADSELEQQTVTPNLGMEWKPSNSFGVPVNGAWSHWIWSGEGKHHRTWLVQPEVRYYFSKHSISRRYGMFYADIGRRHTGYYFLICDFWIKTRA